MLGSNLAVFFGVMSAFIAHSIHLINSQFQHQIQKNYHLESGCEGATFESKPFMTSF